jgi:hypothetical protein
MPDKGSSFANPAAALIPPIVCDLPDDVAEVRVLENFSLEVRFFDGTSGMVDMSSLIQSHTAGVFAVLADPDRFCQARVELGTVTWPGGLDLAPDAMYAALKEEGCWRPR